MTKPFIPHVLKALTASAECDPANERGAVVSFTADAHHYSRMALLSHSLSDRVSQGNEPRIGIAS
jgi:hypothetical protein